MLFEQLGRKRRGVVVATPLIASRLDHGGVSAEVNLGQISVLDSIIRLLVFVAVKIKFLVKSLILLNRDFILAQLFFDFVKILSAFFELLVDFIEIFLIGLTVSLKQFGVAFELVDLPLDGADVEIERHVLHWLVDGG